MFFNFRNHHDSCMWTMCNPLTMFRLVALVFFVSYKIDLINCVSTSSCVCVEEPVKSGTFQNPVFLLQKTDGSNKYLVAEQNGKVHSFTSDWKREDDLYLDLQNVVAFSPENPQDERGLLSIALHPHFITNKKFYTYSVRLYHEEEYAVVSEIMERENKGDLETEKVLLAIKQFTSNRNGGALLFGPDGYLYIGVGDGGTVLPGDEQASTQAQDGFDTQLLSYHFCPFSRRSLLGKMLRIDVNSLSIEHDILRFFFVPIDNPFYRNTSFFRPEIYAYGFRNLFRCSFDQGSTNKELYCGDTGEMYQEEINIIHKGGNYGWNLKEGSTCLSSNNCNLDNEALPIYTYNNSETHNAVIGGYVYSGNSFSDWKGQYIFGDVTGGLMRLVNESNTFQRHDVPVCSSGCPCNSPAYGEFLRTFSQDNQGDLYVMTSTFTDGGSATILKLIPPTSGSVTCGAVVIKLSVTLTISLLFLASKRLLDLAR